MSTVKVRLIRHLRIATMLGIDYESSDEEAVTPVAQVEVSHVKGLEKGAIATNIELSKPPTAAITVPKHTSTPPRDPSTFSAPVEGPTQGPTVPPSSTEDAGPTNDVPPGSPYTSDRLMIQNLTLPAVPNLNIPPSPPGSPPQRATKKFAQFLELKKKEQHFNQRLENSSVLRDPNHLTKLMDFANIGDGEQYVSTLAEGLGVPAVWPAWAFSEELNASQKRITKVMTEHRSKAPRDSIGFVPAGAGTSAKMASSTKVSRQSAAERAIAGLDASQSSRASYQISSKRKEMEHRDGHAEGSMKGRWRSRSRSPKRRRSRSRERR